MDDKEILTKLYHDMYAAMISKDVRELNRIHDDSFVLIHMTGMRQTKQEYIRAIKNGTLNYYSEATERIDITVLDDTAVMTGYSKHTWRLALMFDVKRIGDEWKLTKAQASTW